MRRKGKGTGSDGTAKQSCRKEGGGGKRRREHEERGVNGGDEEEEVRQVGKPGSALEEGVASLTFLCALLCLRPRRALSAHGNFQQPIRAHWKPACRPMRSSGNHRAFLHSSSSSSSSPFCSSSEYLRSGPLRDH